MIQNIIKCFYQLLRITTELKLNIILDISKEELQFILQHFAELLYTLTLPWYSETYQSLVEHLQQDKIKLLQREEGGFVLFYMRPERGTFEMPEICISK